jgi:dTDP-D-glucose 4,6-dehydratase
MDNNFITFSNYWKNLKKKYDLFKKKILITGGVGFIVSCGTPLCKINYPSTKSRRNSTYAGTWRILLIKAAANYTFIKGDIDAAFMDQLFTEHQFDGYCIWLQNRMTVRS